MKFDHPLCKAEEPSGEPGHPAPTGEDRGESERHYDSHGRHDESICREAGDPDSMEVNNHRQRKADLHGGGGDDDLVDVKDDAQGPGKNEQREPQSLGKQPDLDAELRDSRGQVDIHFAIAQVAKTGRKRARGRMNRGRGESTKESYCQKCELETGFEELVRIEDEEAERDCREQVEDAALAIEV